MEWNRSETLALAAVNCTHCEGEGLLRTEEGPAGPCKCVLRAIFRACYDRFRECASQDLDSSRSSFEFGTTHDTPGNWSRKNEEYVADFLLIAKRTLTEEEHKIFRYHYLLGADWRLCCRKMNMDKGLFHHACNRIQHKLGRTFAEPLDQITELDPTRRLLAILALVIFFLVITPVPLSLLGGG